MCLRYLHPKDPPKIASLLIKIKAKLSYKIEQSAQVDGVHEKTCKVNLGNSFFAPFAQVASESRATNKLFLTIFAQFLKFLRIFANFPLFLRIFDVSLAHFCRWFRPSGEFAEAAARKINPLQSLILCYKIALLGAGSGPERTVA